MTKNKANLPVYTIQTFQRKPDTLHFEMDTLEDNVGRLNFASTPHRHDCFFILFITQGTGTHTIDTIEYPVKPFAVYFMQPGQIHGWSFSKDVKGFYFYFSLEFYKSYARERRMEEFPYSKMYALDAYVQLHPERNAALQIMMENMQQEFTLRHAGWEDVLRNCLDILLIQITRCSRKNRMLINGAPSSVNHIRRLQALIEGHFIELKLPSDYAQKMNVTPKHLNTLCKSALNKTVTDLIHERTVLEAKRYLAYTEKSIKQIATALGFNDLSYFMRFFKKMTKQTPDQFRKSVTYIASVHTDDAI